MTPEEAVAVAEAAIKIAVVVHPGDTLVLGMADDEMTDMEMDTLMSKLRQALPESRVVVVVGIKTMAVQRSGDVDPGAGLS